MTVKVYNIPQNGQVPSHARYYEMSNGGMRRAGRLLKRLLDLMFIGPCIIAIVEE